MLYSQMSPNVQQNWIKNSIVQNRKTAINKVHYKDGSGLQFIKFDFLTGGQEIKVSMFVELLFL